MPGLFMQGLKSESASDWPGDIMVYNRVHTHTYGYGSIPIDTIFSGMNIHLPAILMLTRGTRF